MSEIAPTRVTLPGSQRDAAVGMALHGPIDPSEHLTVTVVLRRRGALPEGVLLSRQEIADRAGADPDDITAVQGALAGLGLAVQTVDAVGAASRRMRVSGTVAALAAAFGADLEQVTSVDPGTGVRVSHRHRTGSLAVPASLAGLIVAVLGLDDRPQSRAHFQIARAETVSASFTPLQLAAAYNFPAGTDGAGQTLAIVELGGGFEESDLRTYFGGLGITLPDVTAVGIDGARNEPGADPAGADGEVLLDIEVAGALAPGAHLLVYFAPNTDAGFLDAVATAAHATPTPAAMSISWGQSEDSWTPQARAALDDALADAAALGVTVTVAAGDSGSSDQAVTGAHVDFPASSPHALACGGTSLRVTGGRITSETVWNDGSAGGSTGGGISDAFALPSWQAAAGVPAKADQPGRGVPDVSGDADPRTGYQVLVDGSPQVIGGTSAVAPLWAALICRLSQALGRPLGLVQPALYGAGAGVLRDITSGNNGTYEAATGWDPCTGLGSPDGDALLSALRTTGDPIAKYT